MTRGERLHRRRHKLLRFEHVAGSCDQAKLGKIWVSLDRVNTEIDKLEKELDREHPEPLVIPAPSKTEIDAIWAKLKTNNGVLRGATTLLKEI